MQHWIAKICGRLWMSGLESNTPRMVECFAYYSLCSTQDQWMLNHFIQNEIPAAQSTAQPLLQNAPEGDMLWVIWETRASFQSSRRGESLHACPCPYNPCVNTATSEYEKKGKKCKTTNKAYSVQDCRG